MKTFPILFAILFFTTLTLEAQQWSGAGNTTGTIHRIGKVGIGTSTPDQKLTVAGNVNIGGTASSRLKVRLIDGKSYNSAAVSELYLNHNTGKNVIIGEGTTKSSLIVGKDASIAGGLSVGTGIVCKSINVGGSGSGSIKVRHINGKSHTSTNVDNLYLNYNTGKPVYIGYGGQKSNLLVNGESHVNGGWLRVYGSKGVFFQNYGGGIHMQDGTWVRVYGNKSFYHKAGIMRTDGQLQVGSSGSRLLVKTDGKVGINTTSPDYRLDVNGTIRAKEVRVQTGWSDHVFLPEYELPTLEQEDQFIQENGHLLGFESEKDMQGEVQLADVTNRQQAKIEEMMLHLIELNKKMDQVIQENAALKQALKNNKQ